MELNCENIASIATAIGVFVACYQFYDSKKINKTSFEDSIDQQYRNLSMEIPVDALLGKEISKDKLELRELIYNYLDLCNEQIFLRKSKRISSERWKGWCEGIESNLSKPAFLEVWNEIKREAPDTFSYLEKLVTDKFETDPIEWENAT